MFKIFLILIEVMSFNKLNIYSEDYYEKISDEVMISNELGNFSYQNNLDLSVFKQDVIFSDTKRTYFSDFDKDLSYQYYVGRETKIRDDFNMSSYDSVIYKLDKFNKPVKTSSLMGSNYDSFEKMLMVGSNKIYAAGTTRSSNFDYEMINGSSVLKSGFICLYDDNLNLKKMQTLGNYFDVSITDIKEIDGKIYCLYNYSNYQNKIIGLNIYDYGLNLIEAKEVYKSDSYHGFGYKVLKYQDQLLVIGATNDRKLGLKHTVSSIFVIEENEVKILTDLTLTNSYYHDYYIDDDSLILIGSTNVLPMEPPSKNIKVIIARYDGQIKDSKTLINSRFNGLIKYGETYLAYGAKPKKFENTSTIDYVPVVYTLNKGLNIIKEEIFDIGYGEILKADEDVDGINLLFNKKFMNNKSVFYNAVVLNFKKLKIKDDLVYLKDEQLDFERKSHNDEYNEAVYGTYYFYDYYKTKYFDVYNNYHQKTIRLETNVKDELYYDELKITANANIFLNGKSVPSGYLLKEEGVHELVLQGANAITKVINFELMISDEDVLEEDLKEDLDEDLEEDLDEDLEEDLVVDNFDDDIGIDDLNDKEGVLEVDKVKDKLTDLDFKVNPDSKISIISELSEYQDYLLIISLVFLTLVFYLVSALKR